MEADANAMQHPTVHVENGPPLVEWLQALGMIEPNGQGGWGLTECCKASLAALSQDAPPEVRPVTVAAAPHAWTPRKT